MERQQKGVLDNTLIEQTGKVQVEHLVNVPVSIIVSVYLHDGTTITLPRLLKLIF